MNIFAFFGAVITEFSGYHRVIWDVLPKKDPRVFTQSLTIDSVRTEQKWLLH